MKLLEKQDLYPIMFVNEDFYNPPLPSPLYTYDDQNRPRFIMVNDDDI